MMKSAVLVVVLAAVAMGQRSPYAPRPVGDLEVLQQFKPAAAPAADGVPNRIGGADDAQDQDTGPLRLDEGTIGDPYLNSRLADWPDEHKPFWYLNSKQIMEHRRQKMPAQTPVAAPAQGEADPTETRLATPPRRRPVKVPARPTPVVDDDADFTVRQLGGEPPRRPVKPPVRRVRPTPNWQFQEQPRQWRA